MLSILPEMTSITMRSGEWLYILGWLEGQRDPIDFPDILIKLRTHIQEATKSHDIGF